MFLTGCTMASRKRAQKEIVEVEAVFDEGKGDAFLFDVKIYREGKKNSVRLDVYRSGDSLSLFARGYLGKGVLKGLVFPESTIIYFPTENEFYSGSIDDLASRQCPESLNFEKMIVELFVKTPAELEYIFPHFYLTILEETKKERWYRLESRKCRESIELGYELKEGRFIIGAIDYSRKDESSQDVSFRFKAVRRRSKLNIEIPPEKFLLSIPKTATRIYP